MRRTRRFNHQAFRVKKAELGRFAQSWLSKPKAVARTDDSGRALESEAPCLESFDYFLPQPLPKYVRLRKLFQFAGNRQADGIGVVVKTVVNFISRNGGAATGVTVEREFPMCGADSLDRKIDQDTAAVCEGPPKVIHGPQKGFTGQEMCHRIEQQKRQSEWRILFPAAEVFKAVDA